MGTTTAASTGLISEFFGSVKGVAQDALYNLTNDILPNWTSQQIERQMNDLLNDDTYNKSASLPRVETISTQEPALFDKNKNYNAPVTQDKTGKYLAVGVIALLGVVVVKGLI